MKQIWNYNTHSDKHEYIDCMVYEEWAIDFAQIKWQSDFVEFDFAIEKIRQTDRTFIDFNRHSVILEPEKILCILRKK